MKKIGIIGGGFSGTMTAVQLIKTMDEPCEIILINQKANAYRGLAYNPYSRKHLLNVVTGKMSAFPDQADHFLDWVLSKPEFEGKDKTLIANSFLPRALYGDYLESIWKENLPMAASKGIKILELHDEVRDLVKHTQSIDLLLENTSSFSVDFCVIASGNHLPRNPQIIHPEFYQSENYFQNPWDISSVENIHSKLPVLIIGNGLTMVDTVFGLLEHGYKGEIFSISPNGFNILPHRHNGMVYSKLTEELHEDLDLFELVKIFNKHLKSVKEFGISAEPVIDSLRPHTQHIWKRMSEEEKNKFMARLRHLWGVARHRIPLHSYERLLQLRIDNRLHINSGKIIDIQETEEGIVVEYFDKKEHHLKQIKVSRVINCTGPETDLSKLENNYLKNALTKGYIKQDFLKLGISADTNTFQTINSEGNKNPNLFTLGANLKGELWESTAVNEIRNQAKRLAEFICKN